MKRILFLGLKKSGKTSIILHLIYNKILFTIPTLGLDTYKLKINRKKFILNDVTGQDISLRLWDTLYQYSDAIVYTIESDDYLHDKSKNIYTLISVLVEYNNPIIIVVTNYKKYNQQKIDSIKLDIFAEIYKYINKDIKKINIINYDLVNCKELKDWLFRL